MGGLKCVRIARVLMHGHAFMQNLRRMHCEVGIDGRAHRRIGAAFGELAEVI
jgi:hypothetical protein